MLKRSCKRKQFFQIHALPYFKTLKLATTVGIKYNNNNNLQSTTKAYKYGMEWKMEWNGNFGMEYRRCQNGMEWKISRMNGRQTSILPYQFHTRFCALNSQKNTYRCWMVINNIVTEVFNFNIYEYYLSTNRGTLVVYIAQTVYVLHHCKYIAICNIDVIVDDFDRFDMLFLFFLKLTICQVLNFIFLHRNENSYLLFHSRFCLSLFILLLF